LKRAAVQPSGTIRAGAIGIRPAPRPTAGDALARNVAFCCFTLLLILNVMLPALRVGSVPLRGGAAMIMLIFFALLYTDAAFRALQRHSLILVLAAALASLGVFVSVVNGAPGQTVIEAVTEVHLQVIVTLLVAALLADICGPRRCMAAVVGVIGASGAVAVLQAAGVDFAWSAQEMLANLQRQSLTDYGDLITRRPRGLSFSPIHLGTQMCLAFAAYMAVRDIGRQRSFGVPTADPTIVWALIAFIAVSAASGTRSPILGALVFFGLYAWRRQGTWLPVVVILAGALVYTAWPLIVGAVTDAQPRVARIDDRSVEGRWTLIYYGARLFLDNPLGYGFAFKPFEQWTNYWHDLYMLPSPTAAQSKELHNYALNMLNTYGIGLLLVAPIVGRLLVKGKASLIFFVPYVLHIMFHNSGPFWNDAIVWFVIATIGAAAAQENRVRLGGQGTLAPTVAVRAGAQARRSTVPHRPGSRKDPRLKPLR